MRKLIGMALKNALQAADWSFLACSDASLAAVLMTELILDIASSHIPQKLLYTKKSSHPWLTDDIVHLVAAKREPVGTPAYDDAVKACSVGIMKEYHNFSSRARKKLLEARQSSKEWWNLSRELLSQTARTQSIPALNQIMELGCGPPCSDA